ncbi:MAG: EAL domain-containing protein [Gammaproteobacteria bacterium]
MPARNPIPILIITVSENDAEQINSALRNAGYPVHLLWADNMDSAEHKIRKQKPDLILCSPSVTDTPLQDVVKFRDLSLPNVPVIVLDSKLDPELAAEYMGAGARDQVSLAQMDHLCAVVTRELEVMQLVRDLEQKSLALKEYEQRVDSVVNESRNAIAYVNQGIVLDVNPAFLDLFGYGTSADIEGQPVLELFEGESQTTLKEALRLSGKGQELKPLTLRGKHAEGKSFETTIEISHTEIDGEPALGLTVRNEAVANDAMEQMRGKAQAQIDLLSQRLAASVQQLSAVRNLDLQTGLINRLHFIELLRQLTAKPPERSVRVLLYMRPDRFSEVMDHVGVIASDGVLKGLADMLAAHAAKEDIVGRLDGTVFAILLERPKLDEIITWAENFRAAVSGHVFESMGKSTSLTCSVGYVALDEQSRDAETALTRAKEARHKASLNQGGALIGWTPPKVDAEGRATDPEWQRRITEALKNDRFTLVYQSIASLAGDPGESFDMLVRMHNADGSEVPNKEFIPSAERNGMLNAIDRWVTEHSLKVLHERSKQNRATRLFVRLSDQSLTDKQLLPWLEKLLSGLSFTSGQLVFQVTEKSAEKYISDARNLAQAAHRLQCGFALEHFGLGQNSLHTLGLIHHVDFIKIDGALTAALFTEEDKLELVKKYLARAGELKVHTIAERVERPETMTKLYQLGVGYIQGNYVQEPEVVMADASVGHAAG